MAGVRQGFQIWSDRFLYDRLMIARVIGAAGMWAFVALDYMLHAEQASTLLLFRALAVGVLLGTALLDRTAMMRRSPYLSALLMMWSLTIPLSHMTVFIGGYQSDYYLGVIMAHTGAAVLLPWRWQLHVLAQLGSVLYWFAINFAVAGFDQFYPLGVEALFVQLSFYLLVDLSIFFYVQQFRENFAARQELEETLELLTSREQSKNEYFNAKAEDLRGYLRAIGNRIEDAMIQADKDRLVQYRTVLRPASAQLEKLSEVIDDVLDLYALEVQKLKVRVEGMDLRQVIDSISNEFEEKGMGTIQVATGTSLDVSLRSDPERLRQIVRAVAAYLASVARDKKVLLRVEPVGQESGDLIIEFSANSVGMAPEERIRLFMPYHLSPGSESGLGLILARHLARRLGGNLVAGGRFGESSTFRLQLPRFGAISREDSAGAAP
jgi:signal transduction histidine kinase